MERKAYPSDVSDEARELVAPYLTLMAEDAPQRDYPLREVFNGLRWIVRTGVQWRWMPHDLPPWHLGYQQPLRRIKVGDGPWGIAIIPKGATVGQQSARD